MDNIVISSEFARAEISPKGAELRSLIDKDSGVEFIWNADPKFWPRSAPILFPIVGSLREDKYRIRNKFYSMSRHGFARDMNFELVSSRKDMAQFRLENTDETLKNFPFKFRLNVVFKIYGPKLMVDYEVRNTDKKEMLFSIGSHPAFNVPMKKNNGDKFDDYFLEFDEDEPEGAFYLDNGLINFHTPSDKRVFDGNIIKCKRKIFEQDALIFKDPISEKVTLRSLNHDNFLSIEFDPVPYLGIWSPPNANFICIEPWHGVADSVDSNNDFYEKEGLITLEPGDNFKTGYTVIVG